MLLISLALLIAFPFAQGAPFLTKTSLSRAEPKTLASSHAGGPGRQRSAPVVACAVPRPIACHGPNLSEYKDRFKRKLTQIGLFPPSKSELEKAARDGDIGKLKRHAKWIKRHPMSPEILEAAMYKLVQGPYLDTRDIDFLMDNGLVLTTDHFAAAIMSAKLSFAAYIHIRLAKNYQEASKEELDGLLMRSVTVFADDLVAFNKVAMFLVMLGSRPNALELIERAASVSEDHVDVLLSVPLIHKALPVPSVASDEN